MKRKKNKYLGVIVKGHWTLNKYYYYIHYVYAYLSISTFTHKDIVSYLIVKMYEAHPMILCTQRFYMI